MCHFLSNMIVICYDCIHCCGTHSKLLLQREISLQFRDLVCVCFCVCLLELFVRSSYQHYLQHQFTVHVEIERIQKCAAAAAAAGEKIS